MYQDQNVCCRECGEAFIFTAAAQAELAEKGQPVIAPSRCPACVERRLAEDAVLYQLAREEPSRAYVYRCRRCRRSVQLLRPWKRAAALLYCPRCKPALYKNMPYDVRLNQES